MHQCKLFFESNSVIEEIIGSFSTMPQTSSAVALWMVKLDALIASHLESVQPENRKEPSTRFKGTCCSGYFLLDYLYLIRQLCFDCTQPLLIFDLVTLLKKWLVLYFLIAKPSIFPGYIFFDD